MKLRRIIQVAVFILVLSISIGHTFEEAGNPIPFLSTASVHAVCPFGGVVSIYEFFISGSYVKKIHESSFILMFIVFFLAIIMGPVFCGWICPFGTFQEWISKIGRRIFKKRFNTFIPYKIDKYLRFIRYFVLVMVIVKTAQTAELMFADIDPYYALFNIWSDEVAITAYIALFIVTVLSLFVERPFCKYACPYGALLGITNTFKFFKIERRESTCINCKLCDKKCPMNIPLSNIKRSMNHQCITCLECTSEAACPKENTLVLAFKKVVLKSRSVGIIALAAFIVGIGGTMILNLWQTETSKVPAKYTTKELADQYNPADIRGSYSLQDIENAFGVPVEDLAKAFNIITDNPGSFLIKGLEDLYSVSEEYEVGTDSVRFFVALYKDLPYTPESTTRLLNPAKSILKDKISDDLLVSVAVILDQEPVSHEEVEEVFLIKGKTTFREVNEEGVTVEQIKTIVGSVPENMNLSIRDYANENNIEFETIKTELQALIDK